MGSFKIVLYFVLIFLLTGCFRVIPESAVLPKIYIDKKFTKSKQIIFDGSGVNVGSSKGGLIIVKNGGGFVFINPKSNKKIKELDTEFILIGDYPQPTIATYNEVKDSTSLECIDSQGNSLWKKEFKGKILNSYEDTNNHNILFAIQSNNTVTYNFIDGTNGKIIWADKKKSNSPHVVFNIFGDTVLIATNESLSKLSIDGKPINKHDFNTKVDIIKLFTNENSIIIFGYINERSKSVVKIIDMSKNTLRFEKTIKIANDVYHDVAVDNKLLYIVNNKTISTFDMLTGSSIKSKKLNIEDDSYETLNNIFAYKNKIVLTGLSEIYAYGKQDFSLLWKHEELWTPDRLFRKEKGFNAAMSAGMAAASAAAYNQTRGNYYASGNENSVIGNMYLVQSQSALAANKALEKSNLSQSSQNSFNIAFIRGYSTGSMMLEYNAVVYLINLDTGKSQNIQLKERDSYHCYPNVHVDINNKTIYQTYGTQNFLLRCGTLNQLDIIKYD